MSIWKPLRVAYIKTTDPTHGYQGSPPATLLRFYKLWAPIYDWTVGLDPAYRRGLERMVRSVVRPGDTTLDVGSGTGLAIASAASVASRVVAMDPSEEMAARLRERVRTQHLENVEVRLGYFPEALLPGESFGSVISSFMLAHLEPERRARALVAMFRCLGPGGRLGLFAAQGEIAPSFQTRNEIVEHLATAGFVETEIEDVSDIYRITTATRP